MLLKPGADETPEAFEARVAALQKRLAAEPFAELARFFSADTSAARGGDWGWIKPRATPPAGLADALEALPVGGTSGPVATPAGVYFLRNEGVRSDGLQPLESVRDEIVGILRRAESERLFREWTERLRSKADVRIFRPAM
jgi:parvulin-like peptidyl-prolyl isomerase